MVGSGTNVRERARDIEGQRVKGQEEPPHPPPGQVFRALGCIILSELQLGLVPVIWALAPETSHSRAEIS